MAQLGARSGLWLLALRPGSISTVKGGWPWWGLLAVNDPGGIDLLQTANKNLWESYPVLARIEGGALPAVTTHTPMLGERCHNMALGGAGVGVATSDGRNMHINA